MKLREIIVTWTGVVFADTVLEKNERGNNSLPAVLRPVKLRKNTSEVRADFFSFQRRDTKVFSRKSANLVITPRREQRARARGWFLFTRLYTGGRGRGGRISLH